MICLVGIRQRDDPEDGCDDVQEHSYALEGPNQQSNCDLLPGHIAILWGLRRLLPLLPAGLFLFRVVNSN